jgi:N-acetyl-gamma-glutamyl-phosphate reductase, common form
VISAGIVGATGYVGSELIRLLVNHNGVKISALQSSSSEGEKIEKIYGNLKGIVPLKCSSIDEVIDSSEVVFLSLPSGMSEDIAQKCLEKGILCIDMGGDFRLKDEEDYKTWYGNSFQNKELHEKAVYGLPELNRDSIKNACMIANPGCYPTSIELGLMPALKHKLIDLYGIICDSKSGTTGAGKSPTASTHFPECNESLSPYKAGTHRHTPEIEQVLGSIAGEKMKVTFVPHLLPINRGILSTVYCSMKSGLKGPEIYEVYKEFYKDEPFVRVLEYGQYACIKNVKYSNYCDISLHPDERTGKLIIVSAIDNMVKGAAGQAIQNMNIALGLREQGGLYMVPPAN